MHRLQASPVRKRKRCKPRILCIWGSPDAPMQYVPVMNAIFSAQRAEVAIDALVLQPADSGFLQQVGVRVRVTGGGGGKRGGGEVQERRGRGEMGRRGRESGRGRGGGGAGEEEKCSEQRQDRERCTALHVVRLPGLDRATKPHTSTRCLHQEPFSQSLPANTFPVDDLPDTLCALVPTQATHLTGGLYFRPAHRGAALQYLVQSLTAPTDTRAMLAIHQPQGVDFRASCFCHKRAIDVGYVCSVCLSIFCRQAPSCFICGTAFAGAKRKAAAGTGAAVGAQPQAAA